MKRKPVPKLALGVEHFASATCRRLAVVEVPPLAETAHLFRSFNGDLICDADLGGVAHRWRYRAGRLIRYLVYRSRPDQPAQDLKTGRPTGRMIPNPHFPVDECPWAAGYFAEGVTG